MATPTVSVESMMQMSEVAGGVSELQGNVLVMMR